MKMNTISWMNVVEIEFMLPIMLNVLNSGSKLLLLRIL